MNTSESTEETAITGQTEIIADESVFPIVDSEWQIFSLLYPQAKVNMVYKPETDLMNIFLNTKVKTAIVTQKLSEEDLKTYKQKKISVKCNRVALDAIAFIVHKSNVDTTLSVQEIKSSLAGEGEGKIWVFDHSRSSIVRSLKEQLQLNSWKEDHVFAAGSSAKVFEYVSTHPNSVGVIGLSWIVEPTEEVEEWKKSIKVMSIAKKKGQPAFAPTQNNIAEQSYPLIREVYIYNCQGKAGLGLGFASFLASDRGQRIVLKSGLMPHKVPPREVIVKKQLSLKE